MTIDIRLAEPQNRPALQALLTAAQLPIEDLPEDLSGFALAFVGEHLVGSAGIEPVGPYGLLRSVAVREAYRNRHLGQRLHEAALDYARRQQIREVWLITNTADRYFEKHGFQRVERRRAPAEIAATAQFAGLCPSSAVVMRKFLVP